MRDLVLLIIEDLNVYGGKSTVKKLISFFFNVSFRLVLNYRLGSYLVKRRNALINLLILCLKRRQLTKYNSDISYDANIGRRIRFPHPIGVVIGIGVVIEDDVMIWQNVTLGSHGAESTAKDYPKIENQVMLYSGCQIIGGITIHTGAKVGAGSVVLQDVPKGLLAVGVPARIINYNN